jgi:hypothetical protein
MRINLAALLGLGLLTSSAGADVDYLREIKPILRAHCWACHGAIAQRAGLRLDAGPLIRKGSKYGPVVLPGQADDSLLLERVLGKNRPRMPPEKEGARLSDKEISLLRDWINQGARVPPEPVPPDPRQHWAYKPPRKAPLPRVGEAAGNPIDAFIARERAKHGLKPVPPADRATLLRRVYIDLVGVPPTRAELHAFLADRSVDAYEKVVDQLLASPRYGERWARHWMDIWRYSDPFGLGEEYRYSQRHIWRWRDWIIESLNQDKGYDQMIVEMLAGDEIAPADPATLRATGYLARNWYKFNRNVWIQDAVEYTAAGFLGVTLRCARCHDHKYDPIAQEDYYHFRAFFETHDVRIDAVPGQPDKNKDGVARAFDGKPDAPTHVFVRGDERQPDKSRAMTPRPPSVLGGEAAIRPVHFEADVFLRALEPAAREARRLADLDLRQATSDTKRAIARANLKAIDARHQADHARYTQPVNKATWEKLAKIASRAERQVTLLKAEEAVALAEIEVQKARAGKEDTSPKSKVKNAAKVLAQAEQKSLAAKKAHAAARAALARDDTNYTPLVRIEPAKSTGRRLALARWIADRRNPLTARVAVNHIWLRHFGRPLVATPANFGLNGKKPTHPELFDWLAVDFMESGWSMKHVHRRMVTSATYRLGSRDTDGMSRTADPDNQYYWRMNPRRMEGEVVRDSILAAAGRLDPTMGGPILDEKLGQTSARRSVYFRFNTEYKMQFLDQFDPASPTECYERGQSIIPQQALALYNSALAVNQSRLLARDLHKSAPDAGAFVTAAFEQVLGRPPTPAESQRCRQFLDTQAELFRRKRTLTPFPPGVDTLAPASDPVLHAREDLVHVLFNHNDFVTVR